MGEEDRFLQAILASPEDVSLRLVYADWLEERGDPRGEFLRLDTEAMQLTAQGEAGPSLQMRLQELQSTLDPAWVAFVTTLGRPFHVPPRSRDFFDCEPEQLPFNE